MNEWSTGESARLESARLKYQLGRFKFRRIAFVNILAQNKEKHWLKSITYMVATGRYKQVI